MLKSNVNTEEPVATEYVSATALQKADVETPDDDLDVSCNSSFQGDTLSSSTSSGAGKSQELVISGEMNHDSLDYIAGYMAKKFKRMVANLEKYTYQIKREHEFSLPSWVKQLSYGGLMMPEDDFLNRVKMGKTFQKIS